MTMLRFVVSVASGCLLAGPAVHGRIQSGSPERTAVEALERVDDRDENARRLAFHTFMRTVYRERPDARGNLGVAIEKWLDARPDEAEFAGRILIRQLDLLRIPLPANATGHEREERSELKANLIWAVSALGDSRATEILLALIDTGGMATAGLAKIGKPALDGVLSRASDIDSGVRISVARTLGLMASPASGKSLSSSAVDASRIKNALILASEDQNHTVRYVAVEELGQLPGEDVRKALARVAESDSYSRGSEDGRPIYPLRRLAATILEKRQTPASR